MNRIDQLDSEVRPRLDKHDTRLEHLTSELETMRGFVQDSGRCCMAFHDTDIANATHIANVQLLGTVGDSSGGISLGVRPTDPHVGLQPQNLPPPAESNIQPEVAIGDNSQSTSRASEAEVSNMLM